VLRVLISFGCDPGDLKDRRVIIFDDDILIIVS